MSTDISDAPGKSSSRDRMDDKVEGFYRSARHAFDGGDFISALRHLEQVPPGLRTQGMRVMVDRCQQLKTAQHQYETAKRSLNNGDFEQTIRIIERMPIDSRTEDTAQLLQKARVYGRVKDTYAAAKRSLDNYDYEGVLRVIDELAKSDRTPEINKIFDEATMKLSRMKSLRSEIDSALSAAADVYTAAMAIYAKTLPLLEQLLSLQPNDYESVRRMEEVRRCQEKIERRVRLYNAALKSVEQLEFDAAINLLGQIPEDLRDQEVQELLQKAERCRAERERLATEIVSAIAAREYADIGAKLREMEPFHPDPVTCVRDRLTEIDLESFMTGLACESIKHPSHTELLDRFVAVIPIDRLRTFVLTVNGQLFLDHYSEDGTVLPARLRQVLNDLTNKLDELTQNLAFLRAAARHMGANAQRIQDWDDFLAALWQFEEVQQQTWTWRDVIVQNARTTEFEGLAKRLAQTARRALPVDIDRWNCVERIAQGRLKTRSRLIKRLHKCIERCLQTARWPESPITIITVRRAVRTTIVLSGLALPACLVLILRSYLLDLGGSRGAALTASLSTLWFFFCWTANRILATTPAPNDDTDPEGNVCVHAAATSTAQA